MNLLRLRQHGQLQPSRWSRSSSSTACGSGCARCTSTASASTWRSILSRGPDGNADGRSRRSSGRSSSTTSWPTRRSSPRRGTPPACTRSATSRATAGPSGTAATATTSAASSRATRAWSATVAARIARQRRHLPGARRAADQQHQLHHRHDGFTLNDLVSYNDKHNEANGEGNRDGTDDNLSWNCGVEGDTDDPAIEALRDRQVKNFADDPAAVAGRADDGHGRRGRADPARQQQRLLPGQRDQLVRLDAGRAARRPVPVRRAS